MNTKQRLNKKLTLNRETICGLTDAELRNVAGAKTCGQRCQNQSLAPACDYTGCYGEGATCASCVTCGFSCETCQTCNTCLLSCAVYETICYIGQ
jgi:hypothetical protein